MARNQWTVIREGDCLTLTRRVPVRFDFSVETHFPPSRRLRLAHQVRQDLWRALQGQRGFSPVVQVQSVEGGVNLRAGGRIDSAPFDRSRLEGRFAEVLQDPVRRARWVSHSRRMPS